MMKRKAVIIASSPHDAPLPGAEMDLNSWNMFLSSIAGGAWDYSELLTLMNPNRREVERAKSELAAADYGVTIFLGHGKVQNDSMGIPETLLYLDSDETISERNLNPGTSWYLSVIDCCRQYETIKEAANFSNVASNEAALSRNEARKRFESALEKAEKGWVRFYGADLNQAASDRSSFSDILIRESMDWARSHSGILDTQAAFARVSERFRLINPQQKPVHDAGRRRHFFPIAVGMSR